MIGEKRKSLEVIGHIFQRSSFSFATPTDAMQGHQGHICRCVRSNFGPRVYSQKWARLKFLTIPRLASRLSAVAIPVRIREVEKYEFYPLPSFIFQSK